MSVEGMVRIATIIDNDLVVRARRVSGIESEKELIREALRTLIRLRGQGEIRSLRGKLHWEGDLEYDESR